MFLWSESGRQLNLSFHYILHRQEYRTIEVKSIVHSLCQITKRYSLLYIGQMYDQIKCVYHTLNVANITHLD